jgi:hypothetical protein
MNYLIIIIICILIFILLNRSLNSEYFSDISKGTLKTVPQISDDKMFEDLIVYSNDDEKAGIFHCLDNCQGTCVEYGVTGVAHCFPSNSKFNNNYNTILRNFENEHDDTDKAASGLSFPALG